MRSRDFAGRLRAQATVGRPSAGRAYAARSLLVADVEEVRADFEPAVRCLGCLFGERFDELPWSRRPFFRWPGSVQ